MILVIGEILFDLFPSYKRIGGAPFNFAFHLKQLGFEVRFVSRVGQDNMGRDILDFLGRNGFEPKDIQIDPSHGTGRVKVSVAGDGSHSFSIVQNMAYDHILFDTTLKSLCQSNPELIYFGTLIQRTRAGENLIQKSLASTGKNTCKFCDVNLRPDCYTPSVLENAVSSSNILKLSEEELDILVPDQGISIPAQAVRLLERPARGPDLIMLTQGAEGSIWMSKEKSLQLPQPTAPPMKVKDTVGAGDAYAAMAAAAILAHVPDSQAMVLAHDFAGRICCIKGSLPRDTAIYNEFKSRLGLHGK